MEPKLIYQYKEQIDKEVAYIQNAVSSLNVIVENYENLDIASLKSKQDLQRLINSPKSFCVETVSSALPETTEISGVKLNKSKLLELALPEGLNSFVQLVTTQTENISKLSFEDIDFSDKGVSIKKGVIDSIERKHSVYLDTPERIKFYEMIYSFEKTWTELKEGIAKRSTIPVSLNNNPLFGQRVDNGQFYINQKTLVAIIQSIK